jgi:hypothetical protein
VLTWRYNGVNAGTSDMSIMNSNTRIAATRCSLGTWLFLSNISVDTLHKGDTEEDDDDDDNNNNSACGM